MRRRAGIIGTTWLAAVLCAQAYTSPFTSMAVPGTHNGWSTTPSMVLAADNVWVCTQTIASASGVFKFAANGNWTTNWGGSASLIRVPAAATAPTLSGGDLAYSGLTPGSYRFIFNDSSKAFRLEWAGASPLPPPVYTNLAVVGDFNGWTTNANSLLTRDAANSNLWSGTITLEGDTTFKFQPNGNSSNQWGYPETTSLPVPVIDASACGASAFSLTDVDSGSYVFSLNVSNATCSVISTSLFTISTMVVQGSFIGVDNPPQNMTRTEGTTLWESDHHITNTTACSLRFVANQGVYTWGVTNGTPSFTPLPTSGTLLPALTNFATVGVNAPGRYRITFDHLTGAFTLRRNYVDTSMGTNINLLKNPGFEKVSGLSAIDWGGWQNEAKGVSEGQAPHSGSYLGSLYGKLYPDKNDYASFAQDVAVVSGLTYRASAWMKATTNWVADSMQIKIEWRDIASTAVGDAYVNISTLTTNWVKYSAEGIAPSNAVSAHVVFLCSGANSTGFMHLDDAEFRSVSGRTQNFDTWGSLTSYNYYAPDWSISSGKVIYNIPPGRPAGTVFISQYVEGTGNNKAVEIFNGTLDAVDLAAGGYSLQQYNNGSTTPSVTNALSGTLQSGECLVLARPSSPTNFAPTNAISDLPNLLTNKNVTFNGDDALVLRAGTNILDRVGVVGTNAVGAIWNVATRDRTLTRKSTVFTGTLTAVTASFPFEQWDSSDCDTFTDLGEHEISYLDPNEPYTPAGYSLIMNCGATLTSGEMPGGVGDISFYYRTESMSPAVTMVVETAPDEAGPWTSATTLSGVAASNFTYFVAAINRADHPWLRIRQTDAGTNRFRVDEITVTEYSATRRLEDFNGWTDPAYLVPGNYSRYGWSLENANVATGGVLSTLAALLPSSSSAIVTPAFEGGVGETRFWARAYETGGTAYLLLQTQTAANTNWTTLASFTVTTANNFSIWTYLTDLGAKARLIPDPGRESAEVIVDNVEVRLPELYRDQNFNGWPTRGSYVTETFQGWTISNCIVNSEKAYDGQVARLRNVTGNYILSPEIPDGIGTLSFRTRQWTNGAAFTLQVQVSSNGTSWTTIGSISPSSTNYEQFVAYRYDTTNRFVRLYHSDGSQIALVDDIAIGELQPRPEVIASPGLDPEPPPINETMKVTADIVTRYGATILSVTGEYSVSSYPWVSSPMTSDGFGSYSSVSNIPAQSVGTRIRCRIKVLYAGIGADPNSTTYSTNLYTSTTVTNYVPTIPPGQVWINEIFYTPYDWEVEQDHEYIELCGLAGSDISGWSLQLGFGSDLDQQANSNQFAYATYTFPSGTIFTNAFTNLETGFSFYVLGDQQLFNAGEKIDQILTTTVPTNVNPWAVSDRDHFYGGVGVIRLLDQFGHKVYSLSYGGYATDSDRIPQNQAGIFETNSIGLVGSNYTYSGFTWGMGVLSIGEVNDGQTLVDPPATTDTYAYAWHDPSLLITPANTNLVPPFYMRHPPGAGHAVNIDFYFGFTNSAMPDASGTLHHRKSGGSWSTAAIGIRPGSSDSAGHTYAYGRVLPHTYQRRDTLQYVLEVTPNKSGVLTSYLGSDAGGNNLSTVYTNLAAAQASPFTYEVPIADVIIITNILCYTNRTILQTIGNDPIEPITNFRVYANTNLLTPYYFIFDTNGAVIGTNYNGNPPGTGTWITTNFSVTASDQYGGNIFTVTNRPLVRPKLFYRIHALWP